MSGLPMTSIFAGIDFGDVYRAGVDQGYFGAISTGIFVISQITALLFLIAILRTACAFSTAQSIRVGIGVQFVVTFVFAWACGFSLLYAADLRSYPSVTPPSYELVLYVVPHLRVNLVIAGMATFCLVWLMSYGAMHLLHVPGPERIRSSLIQAAAMHPLIFPLNIVVGLSQTVRTYHPANVMHQHESSDAERL